MSTSSMNVATQTAPSVHHLRSSFVTQQPRFVSCQSSPRDGDQELMHLHPSSSAFASTLPTVHVRDLQDGCDIDQVMLVREVEARQKRDGGEFIKLVLSDRTGRVTAMVWVG